MIPPGQVPLLRGLLSVLRVQPRSGCSELLAHADGQPHPGRVPRRKLWHKIKSTASGRSWQPLQSRVCLTDVHFRNYWGLTQTQQSSEFASRFSSHPFIHLFIPHARACAHAHTHAHTYTGSKQIQILRYKYEHRDTRTHSDRSLKGKEVNS